jgi:hypothetical protein
MHRRRIDDHVPRCIMRRFRFTSYVLAGLAVALIALAVPAERIAMAAPQDTLATSKPSGAIGLGDRPVRVVLRDETGAPASLAVLRKRPPGKSLHLVLKGLSAAEQPGVIYHLYLGTPPDGAPAEDPRHVGSFNFFASVPLPGTERSRDASESAAYSFEITDLADALQRRRLLADPLSVTIIPEGTPSAGARPVIGEITLVAE